MNTKAPAARQSARYHRGVLLADGRIEIVQADLTTLGVDAIVNAANESLLGGGGVDGAIHRAAGPELLAVCRTLGGCATGQAVITPGFELPAHFVIHTVGPVWRGGGHDEDVLLASAYRTSLRLVVEHGLASVAFPAISCGIYGFPLERATRIAVREVWDFVQGTQDVRVVFCVFGDEARATYHRVAAELVHGPSLS
jgi:O-acetyl-ADP-ribose deacetylase (regulator of RNase III)